MGLVTHEVTTEGLLVAQDSRRLTYAGTGTQVTGFSFEQSPRDYEGRKLPKASVLVTRRTNA